MKKNDWRTNIESLAANVAKKIGVEVAKSAFSLYDATCFDNLNPIYYWEVFGTLQQIYEEYDEDG